MLLLYPGDIIYKNLIIILGMDNKELLESLIRSHEQVCTIKRPYVIGKDQYDAYAFYDVTGMRYVLVKDAELWRQNTKEHIFFLESEEITAEDVEHFLCHVRDDIEPGLVREGNKTMPKNHMLTYVTAMFISGKKVSEETRKAVRKARFFRNYTLGIRGYCEARIAVFDLEDRCLIGNPAARSVIKTYKKVFR